MYLCSLGSAVLAEILHMLGLLRGIRGVVACCLGGRADHSIVTRCIP